MTHSSNIKNKFKLISWLIFSVLIGIFLAFLILFIFKNTKIFQQKNNLSAEVGKAELINPELNNPNNTTKSQYFYINKDTTDAQIKISASAYLVGDLNTGEIILSKNQDQKFPLASISKLMTASVANQITKIGDLAQVSKTALATLGTNGELKLGEKIKITDLLYPLLLESSNDAAEVIAQYFGRESFIAKMNQQAEKLQMSKTTFKDPSGLSVNNQSTVSDIFKLTGYLTQKQPEIINITDKRNYTIKKHSWSNISQFLNKDGYVGGKSGYTDKAIQTVVAIFNLPLGQTDLSAQTGYRPIAITLLRSTDRSKDVETILKYLKKYVYYGGVQDANTNWVQEKIGIPEIKDPDFLTFTFMGDTMLDRGVENSVIKNFNNDYSALFTKTKNLSEILKKSDINFANLEGTASDQGVDRKNLYSFRMDPSVIPTLKSTGVSILDLANNHIGDWGINAFTDTLSRLKENEILYTGGGYNKTEAQTPTIIEKYGMKIGFLGFSDKGPDYLAAKDDKAGILLASDPNFDQIIQNASKQVDYLVVTFHFGEEYQTKHNARQEYLAHKAVDDGAKIIIGTHPHVPEDTEVYSPKDCTQSSCTSFIAYSLGNFIFDQSWSKPTMQGMLLEMKLFKDGSMTVKKDITQQNSVFQIEKIIGGKEEKVKFISQ